MVSNPFKMSNVSSWMKVYYHIDLRVEKFENCEQKEHGDA